MDIDDVTMHSVDNCHFFVINTPSIGTITQKKGEVWTENDSGLVDKEKIESNNP